MMENAEATPTLAPENVVLLTLTQVTTCFSRSTTNQKPKVDMAQEMTALLYFLETASGAMLHTLDYHIHRLEPKVVPTHATMLLAANSSTTTPLMANASNATLMPQTALKVFPTVTTMTSILQTEDLNSKDSVDKNPLAFSLNAKNVVQEEDTSEMSKRATLKPALKNAKDTPAADTSSTIPMMVNASKSLLPMINAVEPLPDQAGTTSTECEIILNTTKTY